MPKLTTGRQAIRQTVLQGGGPLLARIVATNTLAVDTLGTVLSVSPIVSVNIDGIGGVQRAELPTGIDPRRVSAGDDLLVLPNGSRYLALQHYPASNRTAAGSAGSGLTNSVSYFSPDITVSGIIVGNQLELTWNPVFGAEYYEIWTSPTGDDTLSDQTFVDTSPTTHWVSKKDGMYFDDGMWYAVAVRRSDGKGGGLSAWAQPTFGGNYATGMLSQNQTTSIPGSLVVALSGSIVRATFTSVDSPTTFTIDVADPMAAHSVTPLFANGDILQFTDTSGNKLWVTVVSSADETTFWRYTVTKEDPGAGTNYTILTGSSVVDWGQTGQGIFIVSADGSYGPGTLWQIVTHTGTPWVSFTVQVSADSTGKVLAGAGDVSLDSNGLTLIGGTGPNNSVKWTVSSVNIGNMYVWVPGVGVVHFDIFSKGTVAHEVVNLSALSVGGRDATLTLDVDDSVPLAYAKIDCGLVLGSGALATNATSGFLYIPSCAGVPTGTPIANTGRVPMVYDSTNDDFYIYRSGWKKVHLA